MIFPITRRIILFYIILLLLLSPSFPSPGEACIDRGWSSDVSASRNLAPQAARQSKPPKYCQVMMIMMVMMMIMMMMVMIMMMICKANHPNIVR